MVEITKRAIIKLPEDIKLAGLTDYYSGLAAAIYRRGLSEHHNSDLLFGSRKETRYCIDNRNAEKLFDELLCHTGLKEKFWSDPWVQNIYADTRNLDLPIGIGLRARQNKECFSLPSFENANGHIELTYTSFGEKDKIRTDAILADVLYEINSENRCMLHGKLIPFLSSSYLRRSMQNDQVRITMDKEISGYRILNSQRCEEFAMPNVSIIEIKYLTDGQIKDNAIELIESYGAMPAPGKHYKLYSENLRANLEAEKSFGTKFSPEYEYELKMDTKNDMLFKKFTALLYSGGIRWMKPVDVVPDPFIRETINEYRILDGRLARFTYNGTRLPRAIIKDRGEFLYGGILRRTEKETKFSERDIDYIKSLPLVGATKRVKEFAEVILPSGNHYSTSIDRSVKSDGGIMYQIEVEYRNSSKENVSEGIIIKEIEKIASIFMILGESKLSGTRKEDWIKWTK